MPLIWSICRRYRLGGPDAEDVAQSVWLQLVNHLDKIRDPAALPGWLATTTRRACGRVVRGPRACGYVPDMEGITDKPATRPSRGCSRPSGTRRYARRSATCPRSVSS